MVVSSFRPGIGEGRRLTTVQKPGKRGFRLYTPWDTDLNASAAKAWAWQRGFFTVLSR